MDSPNAQQLMESALQALEMGDKRTARHYAEQAAALAPQTEQPWLILAFLASPKAAQFYLDRALQINPTSERALAAQDWLKNQANTTAQPGDGKQDLLKAQAAAAAQLAGGELDLPKDQTDASAQPADEKPVLLEKPAIAAVPPADEKQNLLQNQSAAAALPVEEKPKASTPTPSKSLRQRLPWNRMKRIPVWLVLLAVFVGVGLILQGSQLRPVGGQKNAPIKLQQTASPVGRGILPKSSATPSATWTSLPTRTATLVSATVQPAAALTQTASPAPTGLPTTAPSETAVPMPSATASPAPTQTSAPTQKPSETPLPAPTKVKNTPVSNSTYTVAAGDTLNIIALRFNITLQSLIAANNIPNPSMIRAGQVITIPGGAGSPQATARPTTAASGGTVSGSGKEILVDISEQHIYAYENNKLVFSFVASTGIGNSTRIGTFKVLDKIPRAYSNAFNIWMPYWMGIYYSGTLENGIHGLPLLMNGVELWGNLLGRPATYGCVEARTHEIKQLYDWAEIGTPVIIRR